MGHSLSVYTCSQLSPVPIASPVDGHVEEVGVEKKKKKNRWECGLQSIGGLRAGTMSYPNLCPQHLAQLMLASVV